MEMKERLTENTIKEYNIGFSLIRVLMCFVVILCHFWNHENVKLWQRPFYMIEMDAVPVFMLMSFFLLQKTFIMHDNEKMKKRLWRIIWPQIGWAIIYWIAYGLVEMFTGINKISGISDLFWQIVGGHSRYLNPSMWYQTSLIILSVVFFLIFNFLSISKGLFCIWCMLLFSLFMQYSGVNFNLFAELEPELREPLGRTIEMIPYATLGFTISYLEIFEKLKKYRGQVIGCAILMGIFISKYDVLSTSLNGFQYQGLEKVVTAVLFITIAYFVPFQMLPLKIKKILLFMSQYTMGIYCMHRLVAYFLMEIYERLSFQTKTFYMCIVIYVVSFILCFCFVQIPVRKVKQLFQ